MGWNGSLRVNADCGGVGCLLSCVAGYGGVGSDY